MYLLSFLLLLSNSFLCLWFLTIYNVFWCRSIWVSPIWDLLGLMDLDIHFSAQLWKIFSNYQFKYTFYLSLFLISFWNSRKVNIFLFIVCPKSHRFFSTLLMLFLFFSPPLDISNVLFSWSLIFSSSVWLGLILKFSIEICCLIIIFFRPRISVYFFMLSISLLNFSFYASIVRLILFSCLCVLVFYYTYLSELFWIPRMTDSRSPFI